MSSRAACQAAIARGRARITTVALVATAQPLRKPATTNERALPRFVATSIAQRAAVTNIAVQVSMTKKCASWTCIVATETQAAAKSPAAVP